MTDVGAIRAAGAQVELGVDQAKLASSLDAAKAKLLAWNRDLQAMLARARAAVRSGDVAAASEYKGLASGIRARMTAEQRTINAAYAAMAGAGPGEPAAGPETGTGLRGLGRMGVGVSRLSYLFGGAPGPLGGISRAIGGVGMAYETASSAATTFGVATVGAGAAALAGLMAVSGIISEIQAGFRNARTAMHDLMIKSADDSAAFRATHWQLSGAALEFSQNLAGEQKAIENLKKALEDLPTLFGRYSAADAERAASLRVQIEAAEFRAARWRRLMESARAAGDIGQTAVWTGGARAGEFLGAVGYAGRLDAMVEHLAAIRASLGGLNHQ
jgi:hypothetical protein